MWSPSLCEPGRRGEGGRGACAAYVNFFLLGLAFSSHYWLLSKSQPPQLLLLTTEMSSSSPTRPAGNGAGKSHQDDQHKSRNR